MSVDIDDCKKAEDRLRRSEAHLAEAQSLSHTGSAIYNETTVLYWSEETYRTYGFDLALGIPSLEAVFQRIHPDDRDRVRAEAERAFSEKRGFATEYRIVLLDGSIKNLKSISRPVFSPHGRLVEFVGTNIDLTERKQAEEAIRESEYKLREIVETVPGLIWSTGPDGEATYVNQRFLDYVGIGPEEFRYRSWEPFVHPDDLPGTEKSFYQAIKTGSSYEAVHRLRRSDGAYRWYHDCGEPLRDREGRIVQWYGLSIDIDERKRAEDLLRRSEAYLAEAQRLSHTGSFGWTPSSGELHWSHETFRILEYHPSIKPTIERVLQRTHPDDRAMIRQLIDETSSGERDLDITHRLLMPDGSVKFVHVLSHALKDAAGNLEIVGAVMDVTENTLLYRDLAEREARLVERTAELRRSEAYLAEAQSVSHTGSAAYNDRTILYWSEETYRLWEFDPHHGLPSREAVEQRMHPDDRERAREEARRAVRQKSDYGLEYRIVLPTGTIKYIELTSHPKFSAGGELVEVVSTLIDVTERKRAQQEHERLSQLESDLAHMNRVSVMGELAASLSHEITQPIASARNNARAAMHFMERNQPDLGEIREALACVVDDADRARDIIDRIRDHIKKAPPRKSCFDLNKAIDEVIGLARSAITANRVSARTRLTEALVAVEGDRVQLQQVMLNLILNAVEAMSTVEAGARELSISSGKTQTGGVLVCVHDSGPGIDSDHIERVFDTFYTTKSTGVGMGLSICRSIIDAHGGRLLAANGPRGAVFQFTLPRPCKDLMNSGRPAHLTGSPHKDTVSDTARQMAC